MLFLRTVDSNHRSYGGFQWPSDVGAVVTAPDWDPAPYCGGGLHGLLWGEGDFNLLSNDARAVWQVVEAEGSVDLGGKHKFRECVIRYIGDREGAVAFILSNGGAGKACAFANMTVGDYGRAVAGNGSTATAGHHGIAVAGHRGTAVAGLCGIATAGERGTATVADEGIATVGNHGIAVAGNSGKATAADYGSATAADHGSATAGFSGTASVGEYGNATAGYGGKATAGYGGKASVGFDGTAIVGDLGIATAGEHGKAAAGGGGTIIISFRDYKNRLRVAVGYVGADDVLPGVLYRVVGGMFVPAVY